MCQAGDGKWATETQTNQCYDGDSGCCVNALQEALSRLGARDDSTGRDVPQLTYSLY